MQMSVCVVIKATTVCFADGAEPHSLLLPSASYYAYKGQALILNVRKFYSFCPQNSELYK